MLQYLTIASFIIDVTWSLTSFENYEMFDMLLDTGLESMETMRTMGAKLKIQTRHEATPTTPFTTTTTIFNTRTIPFNTTAAPFNTTATPFTTTTLSKKNATKNTGMHLKATTEHFLRVTVGYRKKLPKQNVLPPINTTWNLYSCPEEERPSNIGPYEVPSQRDLMIHVRAVLLSMFRSYHRRALIVLRDMKEATKAAGPKEKSCPGWARQSYRQCVRQVRNRCDLTAKTLVSVLENLRTDVADLIQGKVCNISAMNVDPIQLIRILAMEKVSLEFALPGFLRLLNTCAVYCLSSQYYYQKVFRKPVRHITDQDLVIKHFLTRKGYAQLLKGTT